MTTTKTVVAVTDFSFNGLDVHAGDSLDVRPIEAAALTYQRKAVFPHQYQRRDVVADTPEPKRRRRYRRRDMVADPA